MANNVSLVRSHLLEKLIHHIANADTIYLLVSFVMDSGAQLLSPYLKEAAHRGADIKILTGDYLYVTQPQGLHTICKIDPRIEVRLWRSNGIAFHPKAYMLQSTNGDNRLFVGSSNLSRSALTIGVEWSLFVDADEPTVAFDQAQSTFMEMFYDERTQSVNPESIKQYEAEYAAYHQTHPNLAKHWSESEETGTMFESEDGAETTRELKEQVYNHALQPRPVQIEALQQLTQTRSEGYDKALVVMATGLGKTFLAAMFATEFRIVLFIAHREEILFQAKRAFETVMPNRSCGVYNGQEKNGKADFIFASIFTLGMKQHRLRFSPKDFDLIIVDEFHHAAAKSYQNVIDYFRPEFLLGITATPDRADGSDVYAICDGNVAYRIDFIEAIQRGWLAPFRYIGVYDETDYSQIRWLGSRYDDQELLAAQLKESLAHHIYKAWTEHRKSRTLAFCSSIAQASFLADYFQKQGVHCISLHSKVVGSSRSEAIRRLSDGELAVIFTVDLFNEGVDIPSVDTLLFVRPTESLTIFTQQIGRGLRIHDGKENCTIIDLIGNYRNADVKLRLFDVAQSAELGASTVVPVVPDNCFIDLDTQVINLLQELRKKRQPRKEALRESYIKVKQDLGRRPTYEELHLYGVADSRGYKQESGSLFGFLEWAGELDPNETETYKRYEAWFKELESTGMTKSYKMVLLLAMLERGAEVWNAPITPEQVALPFHAYYMGKEYRKQIDFSGKENTNLWTYDEGKVADLIARMPMSKWGGSSKGLVEFKENRFRVLFSIEPTDVNTVYGWTRQICDYRLHGYFERKGQGAGGKIYGVH